MSDEFENSSSFTPSSFWPLLAILIVLLIWASYQVFATNQQRSNNANDVASLAAPLNQWEQVGAKYKALVTDLLQTAKDPTTGKVDQNAKDIVDYAVRTGILQYAQGTPPVPDSTTPASTNESSTTPPPSTPSTPSTPSSPSTSNP